MAPVENARLVRCIKAASAGAILAIAIAMLLVWLFQQDIDVVKLIPCSIAGALSGFVLAVWLPRGFPLPRKLASFAPLSASTFFFWLLADGLVKGEMLRTPGRRYAPGGLTTVTWQDHPSEFAEQALVWSVLGILITGLSVFYGKKEIVESSEPPNYLTEHNVDGKGAPSSFTHQKFSCLRLRSP